MLSFILISILYYVLYTWFSVKYLTGLICLISFIVIMVKEYSMQGCSPVPSIMFLTGMIGGLMVLFSTVVMSLPKISAREIWSGLKIHFWTWAFITIGLTLFLLDLIRTFYWLRNFSIMELDGSTGFSTAFVELFMPVYNFLNHHGLMVIVALMILFSMLLVVEPFTTSNSRMFPVSKKFGH
uniref:NADH dehydrogenase subunit 6 n=1 Tax=Pedicinus badii TaxID=430776 RepID=A0A7H1K1B0_9NEOP|nr:NADH dehydrogenase subunit 6 [Pedicinus badii]